MSRLPGEPMIGRSRADRRFGRARLSPQLEYFVEKQLGDCLILAHERKAHAQVGLSFVVFRAGHSRDSKGFQIQLSRLWGVPNLESFSLP
jgi:hypothetical protein